MKIYNPFLSMRNIFKEPASIQSASAVSARAIQYLPRPSLESRPLPLTDNGILLRPLNDQHLLEVYREAKAMQLSEDFIQMIEDAIRQRNLDGGEALNV